MSQDIEKSQAYRFKAAAREIGADESADALDRIMGKLDLTKKPEPAKAQSTASNPKRPPQQRPDQKAG